MTFTLLTIITILAAALGLYDGIVRLRGRGTNTLLAVGEIIFAAIMLISIFIPSFPIGLRISAVILLILLILVLVFRGGRGRRSTPAITIIALILDAIVVVLSFGWVVIPGLS